LTLQTLPINVDGCASDQVVTDKSFFSRRAFARAEFFAVLYIKFDVINI
jgi:hypothetical protein